MARGRKKILTNYAVTSNDKLFYTCLAKSGRCSKELAQKYFKIKGSRIDMMVKNGFLQPEPIVIRKKATRCFKLTDYAKRWIKSTFTNINHLYKPCRSGTTHDLHLFEELAKLGKTAIDLAFTEYDIKDKFGERDYASPPDLFIPAFTTEMEDGSIINHSAAAIEITTRTYKQKDIAAKQVYCNQFLNLRKEEIKFVRIF